MIKIFDINPKSRKNLVDQVSGYTGTAEAWLIFGDNGVYAKPGPALSAAVDEVSGGILLTAAEVVDADSYSYYYQVDGGAWQSAATGQGTSYSFNPQQAGSYIFGVTAIRGTYESAMTTLAPSGLFSDVPDSEGIALMAFAESTGWESWTTNTDWMKTGTVGGWYGVTVSGGHVTAIDLSGNNLNGDMDTTLDDFSDLYGNVNLSDNASLTNIPLWTYNVAKLDLTDDLVDDVSGNAMSITRDGDLVYLGADDTYQTAGTDEAAIGKYGLFHDGAGTQYFVNPETPVTQTIDLGTGDFCLWVAGTGSAEVAANTATIAGAGTATDGAEVTFEVTGAGTVDVTITGDLDWCQLESGAFPSSRIYNPGTLGDGSTTSRTTQAADVAGNGLSIALADLDARVLACLSGEGTMICEWRPEFPKDDATAGAYSIVGSNDDNRHNEFIWYYKNIGAADGTNTVHLGPQSDYTNHFFAAKWQGSILKTLLSKDGGSTWTTTTGSFDGAFTAGTHLRLFYDNPYPQWLRNLQFYDKALTDTEIESEVAAW